MTKIQRATFGAGCFWEPEYIFSHTPGVIATSVGFTGGKIKNPSYKQVCYTNTGHAEAVQIKFNPNKISYKEILTLFWKMINPISKNRQGLNFGSQYRTIIFYHSKEQKTQADESKKQLQKQYKKPIATQILKASTFYPAEEYHQKYLEKQGRATCSF